MKKTDFPDKCSECRLLNREKMRAALEGVSSMKKEKEVPALYNLEVVESKKAKGKGPKKVKSEPKKHEENKEDETSRGPVKFAELIKEGSKVFPALPE